MVHQLLCTRKNLWSYGKIIQQKQKIGFVLNLTALCPEHLLSIAFGVFFLQTIICFMKLNLKGISVMINSKLIEKIDKARGRTPCLYPHGVIPSREI